MSSAPSMLQSLSDDLASAVERASQSIVAIHARRRIPSSGVIWRPGVIVTAHHTIQRDEKIMIALPDGSSVAATLAGRDPTTDVAVLRIESDAGVVADRAGAGQARVGQLVLALGRPGTAVTAALGAVSAVGGEWRTWHGGRIDQFIRLDVAVYDGFSGGPLVDASGRVLGINSSGLARASAMTIPSSTVERVAEQLLSAGRVRRGYIGLGLQPVKIPAGLVKELNLSREIGLMVVSLDEDAPAHGAGISLGDIVVSFDGTAASDPTDLLAALVGDRIGTPITLRVLRGRTALDIPVTVGERPTRGGK